MTGDFAAGASGSLKKISKAIMRFLKDKKDQPQHGLRDYLNEQLGDLAVKWYRHGFNRGHRETDTTVDCWRIRLAYFGAKVRLNVESVS
jgi:hypothetical protein